MAASHETARVVLSTLPAGETAQRIARSLVDEKLAACVNLVPGVRSIYRWQGDVSEDDETLAIIKTTVDRYDALAQRLIELHPYEVPELIVLPVAGGHAPYLAWLVGSVAPRQNKEPRRQNVTGRLDHMQSSGHDVEFSFASHVPSGNPPVQFPKPPPPPMHAVQDVASWPDGHALAFTMQRMQENGSAGQLPVGPASTPVPPPQSAEQVVAVSPVSHVPFPQTAVTPLPQSCVQTPTSLAAHTLSPQTADTTGASTVGVPVPGLPSPQLHPMNDAHASTTAAVSLFMRGIVLIRSPRSTSLC